jgi:hypothetical protein
MEVARSLQCTCRSLNDILAEFKVSETGNIEDLRPLHNVLDFMIQNRRALITSLPFSF